MGVYFPRFWCISQDMRRCHILYPCLYGGLCIFFVYLISFRFCLSSTTFYPLFVLCACREIAPFSFIAIRFVFVCVIHMSLWILLMNSVVLFWFLQGLRCLGIGFFSFFPMIFLRLIDVAHDLSLCFL